MASNNHDPENMDSCSVSAALDCSRHALRHLDVASMSAFTHLVSLDLDDNFLTEIPSSLVPALPLLQQLSAARNKLKCLPDNVGDWMHLKEILVPFNKISYLPVSMSQLDQLKYLDMQWNPLNPTLHAVLNLERSWNPESCRRFARDVYLLAVQLPRALRETERARLKFERYCPSPTPREEAQDEPLPKVPPKPTVKAPTSSLSVKAIVARIERQESGPPLMHLNTELVSELEVAPILGLGPANAVMGNNLVLQAPPRHHIGAVISVLLKMSAGISICFGMTLICCGILADSGIVEDFFATSVIGQWAPVWAQSLFIASHSWVVQSLNGIWDGVPIHRTPITFTEPSAAPAGYRERVGMVIHSVAGLVRSCYDEIAFRFYQ